MGAIEGFLEKLMCHGFFRGKGECFRDNSLRELADLEDSQTISG